MLQDEGFVGVVKGSKWMANFIGQIHVCCDDELTCRLVQCDCYEVVKSVVLVLIVILTANTSNEQKNLMEEVVFGW